MTQEAAELVERLCQIGRPDNSDHWETCDKRYLAEARVSAADVPGLIAIARQWSDPDWQYECTDSDALLPITAWRALADLQATEAIQPLIEMLCELTEYNERAYEDLPHVFGKIGEPAIEPLMIAARNEAISEEPRLILVEGLSKVAQNCPDARDRIVAYLTEMMRGASPDHTDLNTVVLSELVDLHAVEAAEPIERAFANDLLDVARIGDWEAVRRILGVEGLRLKMPKNPISTIAQLRKRLGIGIFSSERVFWRGEIDEKSAAAYKKRAFDTFSKSREAQEAIDRFGRWGWFQTFLDFGVNSLYETVDGMSVNSVKAFLFGYVPRKVSARPDEAAAMIGELALFWQYLDRVYELPQAKEIVEWLHQDGLVAQLKGELSDSSNYGMAKSIVTTGIESGYDLTTEQGVGQFMDAYNRALRSGKPLAPPPARQASGRGEERSHQRVGRNEPCPCGSGKKFKKCCGGR